MKPRIFVSSTFYDLKYMRDDLANFIKAHDFEPIMFEEGDIGYTPGKKLDESCYEAMRNADMVILIIGGNYGSPASGENVDSFNEYLSVTRREYQTAASEGIPIFVFIDASVYSEYSVYEANSELIEKKKENIIFCATKSINIFRFIKEIKMVGSLPIIEFKKAGEIKSFLGKQWADMFKNYLKSLKEEKNTVQIHDALDSMSSLIKQMEIMLNGLGKKVINNDTSIEFKELLDQQRDVKIKEIAKKISRSIVCRFTSDKGSKENVKKLINVLCHFLEETEVDDTSFCIDDYETLADMLLEEGIILHKLSQIIFSEDCLKVVCNNMDMQKEVENLLSFGLYYSRLTGKSKEENND